MKGDVHQNRKFIGDMGVEREDRHGRRKGARLLKTTKTQSLRLQHEEAKAEVRSLKRRVEQLQEENRRLREVVKIDEDNRKKVKAFALVHPSVIGPYIEACGGTERATRLLGEALSDSDIEPVEVRTGFSILGREANVEYFVSRTLLRYERTFRILIVMAMRELTSQLREAESQRLKNVGTRRVRL